jgi:nitrogen regulatory protein P-II 1
MAQLIVLVVDQLEKFDAIAEAWHANGVDGLTILESTGLGREVAIRDDLPLIPSLRSLFEGREETHRTIMAVVSDTFNVERLFDVTEAITGPLDAPNTGIMWVVPVTKVRGLNRWK